MKKNMSKQLATALRAACIGALVLGIGEMERVYAYPQPLNPIGYQADGGSLQIASHDVYIDQDGTVQWQMNGEYVEDNSVNTGNVSIGNFSKAGSLGDYIMGNATVYRESDDGWHIHQGKKYRQEYVSYIEKEGKYYQQAGTDAEGNQLFYELNDALQKKDENEAPVPLTLSPGITNNVAVGNKATTKSSSSVAIGDNSQSQGYRGIAIGADSQAGDTTDSADYNDGISAVAIGDGAKALGNGSIATGQGSHAYGYASVASGVNAGANTTRAIAIGENATVSYLPQAADDPQRLVAEQAIAIGYSSQANGKDATAVGRQAVADRRNSSAYGNNSHANAYNSVAIGNKAIAGLQEETGNDPLAGQSAVAIGNRATATQEYTTAVGASTYASGWHAVAVGDSNRATGRYSTAMGAGHSLYTVEESENDNTEGERTYQTIGANQATGDYSTSVGYGNATMGQNSSAFGMQNVASGLDSLAYGSSNSVGEERQPGDTTLQRDAASLGNVTGFAVGHANKITGNLSGTFGDGNHVTSAGGYAVGNGNQVSGQGGFAAGNQAAVTAENGIAIGNAAQASIRDSVALGNGAQTREVVGTSTIEIPGTGTTYSNISGTAPVGTVSVGDEGKERTITNVAAGRIGPGSTDAVNGSELYAVSQQVGLNSTEINNINNRINNLDQRLNKVGAGAAALAMLHPLDFDPDEKWDFATGYGHYGNENAFAIGAFYRPNEDTMFSVGGVVGDGHDMIGASISWKFGQKNHVSVNRVAAAKEIIELRKELNDLRSFVADAVSGNVLDLSKIQLFPDVPENHWAYDYVSTLAGNGILEGYPDGYFDGHRAMTRYEMAGVLYRAMLRGVKLKERALREFAPELDRIRVDTLTRHQDGSPAIQRVRTIPGKGC